MVSYLAQQSRRYEFISSAKRDRERRRQNCELYMSRHCQLQSNSCADRQIERQIKVTAVNSSFLSGSQPASHSARSLASLRAFLSRIIHTDQNRKAIFIILLMMGFSSWVSTWLPWCYPIDDDAMVQATYFAALISFSNAMVKAQPRQDMRQILIAWVSWICWIVNQTENAMH